MVSVPLARVLQLAELSDLIPKEYERLSAAAAVALVGPLASDPEIIPDRTVLGVVADWCRENGEPDLAAAWAWLHKRPEVEVQVSNRDRAAKEHLYSIQSPPRVLGYSGIWGVTGCGVSSMVCELADRLAEMRRDLE